MIASNNYLTTLNWSCVSDNMLANVVLCCVLLFLREHFFEDEFIITLFETWSCFSSVEAVYRGKDKESIFYIFWACHVGLCMFHLEFVKSHVLLLIITNLQFFQRLICEFRGLYPKTFFHEPLKQQYRSILRLYLLVPIFDYINFEINNIVRHCIIYALNELLKPSESYWTLNTFIVKHIEYMFELLNRLLSLHI